MMPMLAQAVISAPEQIELGLEQALQIALKNNSDLRTQAISLEAARRAKDSSWNKFLPSASLNAGISNAHSFDDLSTNEWSWSASGGISLGLSLTLPTQIKQTVLSYEIALASFKKAEKDISTRVASAFYALLAEYESIGILEDSLTLAKLTFEQVQARYNRGLASELELLRAQYTYLEAEPSYVQAVDTYKANCAQFRILLGLEDDVIPVGVLEAQKISVPSDYILHENFLEQRYDIMQRKQAIEQARLAKTLQAYNTVLPSLSLSENIRVNTDRLDPWGGKPTLSGSFSISASIPLDGLIPGSTKNLNYKSSQDSIELAEIALYAARVKAEQDITSKALAVQKAWRSIDALDVNYSIANRSYTLTKDAYDRGLMSQAELETSRQQMVQANQNKTKAVVTYIGSVYNLADALNISVEQLYALYGEKS